MDAPLFSIILPVYNGTRYLREAIESVQAQTERSWELIALDDGSADGSGEMLEKLAAADSRIRFVRHANCGVATTRNRGLAAAHGYYVTFLDQDDLLHPRALSRFAAAFAETGADAVGGMAVDFLTPEGARRFCSTDNVDAKPSVVPDPVAATLHPKPPYSTGIRASVWARGYRRSALDGLKFPDGVFGADDWVFTMRVMAKVRRYAALPDTVYLHRSHPDNISAAMPMRYIVAMLDAVGVVAGEWCDDAAGPHVTRSEFAHALSSHVQLWGMMLPSLKRYSRNENRAHVQALVRLRKAGLLPFVSASHALRYWLVAHGLKSLLPVIWRRRFRNMANARANHAEEVG